eukprot:210466_1
MATKEPTDEVSKPSLHELEAEYIKEFNRKPDSAKQMLAYWRRNQRETTYKYSQVNKWWRSKTNSADSSTKLTIVAAKSNKKIKKKSKKNQIPWYKEIRDKEHEKVQRDQFLNLQLTDFKDRIKDSHKISPRTAIDSFRYIEFISESNEFIRLPLDYIEQREEIEEESTKTQYKHEMEQDIRRIVCYECKMYMR